MITVVINVIKEEVNKTFDEVLSWLTVNNSLLQYSPDNKGWNIRKILQHIFLTNHYLLILIRKGAEKAIEKSKKSDFSDQLKDYDLDWEKLKAIGDYKSFEWIRPEHMEPDGKMSLEEIHQKLQLQLNECLNYLNQLQHGEGVLYKTMMTVNGLGKIDVYHYIYFLVQHARRHLAQMERVEHEYNLGI